MGLAAIGNHKVVGPLTAGNIFMASAAIGDMPGSGSKGRERVVKIARKPPAKTCDRRDDEDLAQDSPV